MRGFLIFGAIFSQLSFGSPITFQSGDQCELELTHQQVTLTQSGEETICLFQESPFEVITLNNDRVLLVLNVEECDGIGVYDNYDRREIAAHELTGISITNPQKDAEGYGFELRGIIDFERREDNMVYTYPQMNCWFDNDTVFELIDYLSEIPVEEKVSTRIQLSIN